MALVFGEIQREEDGYGLNAHFVEIVQLQVISSFSTSDEVFYGQQLPDVAFAQLAVCGLQPIELAHADWSVRVGMEVATAGFPMGEDPLIVNGLLGQGTPLLRRGIVSAVNPFPCPQPDAFTIDVMSQGGASGSPIFRTDAPEVVGILYGGFPQANITLAVPAVIVSEALKHFLREHGFISGGFPTLASLASSAGERTNGQSMWRRLTRRRS